MGENNDKKKVKKCEKRSEKNDEMIKKKWRGENKKIKNNSQEN